jgi:hypothetical protein
MQRKKLGTSLQTLSPEEAAFLKAAEPTAAVVATTQEEAKPVLTLAPPLEKVPHPLTGEAVELAPEPAAEKMGEKERVPKPERERKEKRVIVKEVSEMPEVLVADSIKLPQALHRRLLRASSERKLDRRKPYTKQDIVAAAIDDWLSKHGYGSDHSQ